MAAETLKRCALLPTTTFGLGATAITVNSDTTFRNRVKYVACDGVVVKMYHDNVFLR